MQKNLESWWQSSHRSQPSFRQCDGCSAERAASISSMLGWPVSPHASDLDKLLAEPPSEPSASRIMTGIWPAAFSLFLSVGTSILVFPFFTFVPTSGWLGSMLPQVRPTSPLAGARALWLHGGHLDNLSSLSTYHSHLPLLLLPLAGLAPCCLKVDITDSLGLLKCFAACMSSCCYFCQYCPSLHLTACILLFLLHLRLFAWLAGRYADQAEASLLPLLLAPACQSCCSAQLCLLAGWNGAMLLQAAGLPFQNEPSDFMVIHHSYDVTWIVHITHGITWSIVSMRCLSILACPHVISCEDPSGLMA